MSAADFTFDLYQDCCWSYGPQPMTHDDAAYNLREYRAEGLPVPDGLTAERFCDLWNLFFARDTMETEAIA